MAAPFRITRPDAPGTPQIVDGTLTSDLAFRFYLERLIKMIPAEVVSLYIVGIGIIPEEQVIGMTVWAIICLIGLFFIRIYGTANPVENKPPDWTHIMISVIAFVIWVYSLGGPFAAWGLYVPWAGSLVVLAWTFFVPIFYKGPAV